MAWPLFPDLLVSERDGYLRPGVLWVRFVVAGADKEGTDVSWRLVVLSVTEIGPVHCQLPANLINISSLAGLHSVCRFLIYWESRAAAGATSVGALAWLVSVPVLVIRSQCYRWGAPAFSHSQRYIGKYKMYVDCRESKYRNQLVIKLLWQGCILQDCSDTE